jgi:hypothetical protein
VYNASYHNARKVIKYAGFLAGTERVFRPGSMRNLTYRMDILTREHAAAVFLEPDPVVGADGDVAPGRYFRRRARDNGVAPCTQSMNCPMLRSSPAVERQIRI